MAHSFSADSARRKAFDDSAVGDEIEYLTRKIIAASEAGKRKVEIKGNTRMTGRNMRVDFSEIVTGLKAITDYDNGDGSSDITSASHGLAVGDLIMIVGATHSSISEILNGKLFTVSEANRDRDEFSIEHSGSYTASGVDTDRGSFFKISSSNIAYRDDAEAKAYYKVWKGDLLPDDQNPDYEETALTRQMDAVIRHFRDRGYSILRKDNGASRVTGVGSTGADTFYWEITW